ncbi:hypothetical protein AGLY_013851 [Aphis glycines]|uniref:Uncharacterized protein n=1 Tax=Aphis glycines TaxID=307491 RepID=A0A6G0T5L8_APHGL|nr:hypothetical protein AGLY_013851 [Aphis glycines]
MYSETFAHYNDQTKVMRLKCFKIENKLTVNIKKIIKAIFTPLYYNVTIIESTREHNPYNLNLIERVTMMLALNTVDMELIVDLNLIFWLPKTKIKLSCCTQFKFYTIGEFSIAVHQTLDTIHIDIISLPDKKDNIFSMTGTDYHHCLKFHVNENPIARKNHELVKIIEVNQYLMACDQMNKILQISD